MEYFGQVDMMVRRGKHLISSPIIPDGKVLQVLQVSIGWKLHVGPTNAGVQPPSAILFSGDGHDELQVFPVTKISIALDSLPDQLWMGKPRPFERFGWERRGHWYDEWEALTCLRAKGCPVRLLDELEDWLNVPIVDAEKLRRYKERCAGL